MAVQGSSVTIPRKVTVASSRAGAPRLDFCRFSLFGPGDDAYRSALPRTKSSSDILAETMDETDDDDGTASLDERHARPGTRARDDHDRENMADLIQFLRTASPPPQNYLPSAFDVDGDATGEPKKWKQLRNKLCLRLHHKDTSPESAQVKPRLPDSAVVTKTSRGHPHIAISVPMEHCHLGPDSDWSVAAFNATKPLPPSPPLEERYHDRSHVRSDRTIRGFGTGSKDPGGGLMSTDEERSDWATIMIKHALPKLHTKDSQTSIRLWQREAPVSAPQSAPNTAGGNAHGLPPSPPPKGTGASLPMNPDAYVEIPRSSWSSFKAPGIVAEDRRRQLQASWTTTTHASEPVPGPPSRSPPHPTRSESLKGAPSRSPEHLKLPVRKSSLRQSPIAALGAPTHRSIDCMLEVPDENEEEAETKLESSPPNPRASSEHPIASSVARGEPELAVANARASKDYSAPAAIGVAPCVQSGPTLEFLPAATYSPAATNTFGRGSTTKPEVSPKSSFKKNDTMRSRAEKVKSLKHRDMDKARALRHPEQQQQTRCSTVGLGLGVRPASTTKSISSLYLASRGKPCLSTFVEQFPRPPTAEHFSDDASDVDLLGLEDYDDVFVDPASHTSQDAPTFGFEDFGCMSPSRPDHSFPERDSNCSFEAPARYSSYHRRSWASSVPLLDRISSYAPSETSFMQILDSVSPESNGGNVHRRSDSATLPRMEQERLAPSRLSYASCVSNSTAGECRVEEIEENQPDTGSTDVSSIELNARLNRTTAAQDIEPSASTIRRWSASTVTTPGTVVVPPSTPPTSDTNSLEMKRRSKEHATSQSSLRRPSTCESSTPAQRDSYITHHEPRRAHPLYLDEYSLARLDEETSSRFDRLVQQRGSHALLRMSSSELRAYYAALRSSERTPDLAHHMLLSQERLELGLRKQEQLQKMLLHSMRPMLEELRQRVSPTESSFSSAHSSPSREERKKPHRASCDSVEDWDADDEGVQRSASGRRATGGTAGQDNEMREGHRRQAKQSPKRIRVAGELNSITNLPPQGSPTEDPTKSGLASPGKRHSQQQQQKQLPQGRFRLDLDFGPDYLHRGPAANGDGLDGIEPLMRELQGASRVSLEESPGRGCRGQHSCTAAVGGQQMDAYFNMI